MPLRDRLSARPPAVIAALSSLGIAALSALAIAALSALAIAALSALAIAVPVAQATTWPTVGPAGMAFYSPPSPLPALPHGSLIWYRPATLRLGLGGVSVKAWTVLYLSQSVPGTPDAVTGTVIVPSTPWTGPGTRPVVDYAVGTQGLSQDSAPSLKLVNGLEYERIGFDRALRENWAVEVTDYAGYTNGATPDYIVGPSEGHAVLDLETAALQIPDTGISPVAPVAIWGYSQGGQASAWAAQLWAGYNPSMKLVGDASGGVPGDLEATAENLNGGFAAAFLMYSVVGLNTDYPSDINLDSLLNPAGAAAVTAAETDGLGEALLLFAFKNIDEYTIGGETLDQLLAVPSIAWAVEAQQLGTMPIRVPMFHYHGSSDHIVPLAQDEQLNATYCSMGDTVQWQEFPGGHIPAFLEGMPDAVKWIAARFAGDPPPDNCATSP